MIPLTSVTVAGAALRPQDNTAMAGHQQLASDNVKTVSRCPVVSADTKQTLVYLRRRTHVGHISVSEVCLDGVAWREVNE